MRVGLVTIQKNRAPWLAEWVAFHSLVGFSKFYVYAHNCTDNTADVLKRLSTIYDINAHVVTTTEDRVQLKAYMHAYEQFGHECDWFAFIDGDEFLFPVSSPTIGDALEGFHYLRLSGIGVYWACFGSSGHLTEPEGLIVKNFRRRPAYEFDINRHVKSIIRGRQASSVGPNSHLFQTPYGTVDEKLRPIDFGWTKYQPSYEKFRINHYVCQSYQYFKNSKQTSGAADAGSAYIRPDDWWGRHDINDQYDDSLEHLYARLEGEVAKFK
jgi:hypothetical protein